MDTYGVVELREVWMFKFAPKKICLKGVGSQAQNVLNNLGSIFNRIRRESATWSFKKEDNHHFDVEMINHMSYENYEKIGNTRDLDLLFISHFYVFYILEKVGALRGWTLHGIPK